MTEPPEPQQLPAKPEFYRVVTVRANGTERVVKDIERSEAIVDPAPRAQAIADAEALKAGGEHSRVYSSTNGSINPGDLVWDSAIEYG